MNLENGIVGSKYFTIKRVTSLKFSLNDKRKPQTSVSETMHLLNTVHSRSKPNQTATYMCSSVTQ